MEVTPLMAVCFRTTKCILSTSSLFSCLLFALMQIGNPKDYEKKIKAKPNAPLVLPANAHEDSGNL